MSSPRRNSPPQQEVEGGNSWARHRATPTTNNNNNSINRNATTTTLTPRPSVHHSGSGDATVMKTTPAHHHQHHQEHRANTSPSSSPPRAPASSSKTTIQSLSSEVTRFQELRDKQLAKLAKLQQQQQQPLADQPYQQQHHHSQSRASPRAPMVPQQQQQPTQNLQRQDSLAEVYQPYNASPSQQRQQEPSSPTNEDSIAQTPRLTLTTLARHHEALKHQQPRRPSPQARNNNINDNANDMFDQQQGTRATTTTAMSPENASSRAKKFVGQVNDVVKQLTKLQHAIEEGVNVVAAEAEEERKTSPYATHGSAANLHHIVVASSPQKFVPDPHLIIDSTQPIETQLDNSVLILTASISHLLQQFEEASQTAGEVRVHQLRETIQHIKKLRTNVESGIEMADQAYSSPHSPRRAQALQELEQEKKTEEEHRLAEQQRFLNAPANARRRSNTTTGLAAEKRKLDEVLDEEVFQLSHGIRHLVADVKWITEFVVDTHADDRTKELVDLEATLTESKAQIEQESSHHSPVEQKLQEMGLTVDEWKEAQAELQNAAETSRSGFQGKKQSHVDQLREIIQDRANLRKELEELKFEHAELLKTTCREKEFDERKLVEVDNVAAHRDLQLRFASTKHVLESVNAEEHLGEKLMQLYQDKKKQDDQIQNLKNELAQLQSQSSADSSEKDVQLQQALKSNKQFKEDLEKIKKEKDDIEAEADVKISDLKLRLKLTEEALANAKKQRDNLEQDKDQTIDDMRNDIAFSQKEVRDVKIEKTKNENAAKAQIEDLEEKLKEATQEMEKIKNKSAKRDQELHEKIASLEKEMEEIKLKYNEAQEKNIKQEQSRRNNETASEQERREQQEVAQNEINNLKSENATLLEKVSELQNNLNESREKFKNEIQNLRATNERESAVELIVRSESEVRRNLLDEENDERLQKIFEEFGYLSKKISTQERLNENAKQQETEKEVALNKEKSKTEKALRNEKAEGTTMKQMFVVENFVKQEIELRGALHREENDKRSKIIAELVNSVVSSSSSIDQATGSTQQELAKTKQDLSEAKQSSQILSQSFVVENLLRRESESRSTVVVAQENDERISIVSQFVKTLPIQQQQQQQQQPEEDTKSRELKLSSSELPDETLKRSEQALREMFVVENLLHREVEARNAVILQESAEIAVDVAENYQTIHRALQETRNDDLFKEKQEHSKIQKSLEDRIAELEKEKNKLLENQQQQQRQNDQEENTKSDERLVASQQENQKLTDNMLDLEKQIQQLQESLESQKKQNEDQIVEKEAQIRDKEAQIVELRNQLQTNTQQKQLNDDEEETTIKRNQQQESEELIKKHEHEKKELQDQVDLLNKNSDEMKKNLDSTRQELEEAHKTIEKIEQEKLEGLKSLHDQQQQKEDSDKKLIQDELALLQQQNEQAIEELKKKLETEQNAEIEALKKQHQEETKQVHDETEKQVSDSLNAKINDKNEQIKQIHQELDKEKENSHLKDEKIAHLEAESASAKSKNSDSNLGKEKEVASLKQQLQEAQDALLKQQLEAHDRETELNSAIGKLKEELANVQEQQRRHEETARAIPVDSSKQLQQQQQQQVDDNNNEQNNLKKNNEHELKILAEIKRLQENFDRDKKSLEKEIADAHDDTDAEKLAASKAKIEYSEKLEEVQNELSAARQDASDAHNHAKELADLLVQTRDLLKNNEEKLTQDNQALQQEKEKLRAQIEKLQEEIRNEKIQRQGEEIERAHHQEQQKSVRSIPSEDNNKNNEHLLDDLKQQHEVELQQTKRKLKDAFDLERGALREMFLAETLARQESEARSDLQANLLLDSSQDHHKLQNEILRTQAKIVEDTKIQLDNLKQEFEQQRKSTQVLREEFLNENHLRREAEMRRDVEQSESEEFITYILSSSAPPQRKSERVVEDTTTTNKFEDEEIINSLKIKNQQLQDEIEKMTQDHNDQLQKIQQEAKKIEEENKKLHETLSQCREEALGEISSLRSMYLITHMEKTELERRINNVLDPNETEFVDMMTENVKELRQKERDHDKQQQQEQHHEEESSRSIKNSDEMNEHLQKQEKEIESIKQERDALRMMFLTSQLEHTELQRRTSSIIEPCESELVEILKEILALANEKPEKGQNNQQQMEKTIQSLEDQLDEQIKKENTLKLLIAESLAREKIGRDSLHTILDLHQSEIQQRMIILVADKNKAKQSSDKAVADEKTFYRKRVRDLQENDNTLRDIFLIENFFCREIANRLKIVEEENIAFVHGNLLRSASEKSQIHQNEIDSVDAKLRSAVAVAQNDQAQQEKQVDLKKDADVLRELFLIENLQHREGQRRLSIADDESSEMFGILSRINKKLSQVANSRKEDIAILRDMFMGEACMRNESEGRAQIFTTQNEDFLALAAAVINAKTQQQEAKDRNLNDEIQKSAVTNAKRSQDVEAMSDSVVREALLVQETETRLNSIINREHAEFVDVLRYKFSDLVMMFETKLVDEKRHSVSLRECFIAETVLHRETQNRMGVNDDEAEEYLDLLNSKILDIRNIIKNASIENNNNNNDNATVSEHLLQKEQENSAALRESFLAEIIQHQETKMRATISDEAIAEVLEILLSAKNNEKSQQAQMTSENSTRKTKKLTKSLNRSLEDRNVTRSVYLEEYLLRQECEQRLKIVLSESSSFICDLLQMYCDGIKNSIKIQQEVAAGTQKHLKEVVEEGKISRESLSIETLARQEIENRFGNSTEQSGEFLNSVILPFFKQQQQQHNNETLQNIKGATDAESDERIKKLSDEIAKLKDTIKEIQQENETKLSEIKQECQESELERDKALKDLDISVKTVADLKEEIDKLKQEHSKNASCLREMFLIENIERRQAEARNGLESDALSELLNAVSAASSFAPIQKTIPQDESSTIKNFESEITALNEKLSGNQKEKSALATSFLEENLCKREAEVRNSISVGALFESLNTTLDEITFLKNQSVGQRQSHEKEKRALTSNFVEQTLFKREAEARCKMFLEALDSSSSLFSQMRIAQESLIQQRCAQNEQNHVALLSNLYEGRINILQDQIIKERDDSLWKTRLALATKAVSDEADFNAKESKKDLEAVMSACDLTVLNIKELDERSTILMDALSTSSDLLLGCFSGARRIVENENELALALQLVCDKLQGYEALSRLNVENEASLQNVKLVAEFVSAANLENVAPHAVDWVLEPVDDDDDEEEDVGLVQSGNGGGVQKLSSSLKKYAESNNRQHSGAVSTNNNGSNSPSYLFSSSSRRSRSRSAGNSNNNLDDSDVIQQPAPMTIESMLFRETVLRRDLERRLQSYEQQVQRQYEQERISPSKNSNNNNNHDQQQRASPPNNNNNNNSNTNSNTTNNNNNASSGSDWFARLKEKHYF